LENALENVAVGVCDADGLVKAREEGDDWTTDDVFETLEQSAPRAMALRTFLVDVTEYRMVSHWLDAASP
jgi:hypothetical protein